MTQGETQHMALPVDSSPERVSPISLTKILPFCSVCLFALQLFATLLALMFWTGDAKEQRAPYKLISSTHTCVHTHRKCALTSPFQRSRLSGRGETLQLFPLFKYNLKWVCPEETKDLLCSVVFPNSSLNWPITMSLQKGPHFSVSFSWLKYVQPTSRELQWIWGFDYK